MGALRSGLRLTALKVTGIRLGNRLLQPDELCRHVYPTSTCRLADRGDRRAVLRIEGQGGAMAIDFTLMYPEMVDALIPVAMGLSGFEGEDSCPYPDYYRGSGCRSHSEDR